MVGVWHERERKQGGRGSSGAAIDKAPASASAAGTLERRRAHTVAAHRRPGALSNVDLFNQCNSGRLGFRECPAPLINFPWKNCLPNATFDRHKNTTKRNKEKIGKSHRELCAPCK